MTTRYFQAEITSSSGQRMIVFRASQTKVYASAQHGRYGIMFSGKPASFGASPTVEITKAEYDALTALKVERLKAAGRNPAHYTSPQDSWVLAPQPAQEG